MNKLLMLLVPHSRRVAIKNSTHCYPNTQPLCIICCDTVCHLFMKPLIEIYQDRKESTTSIKQRSSEDKLIEDI